MNEKLLTINDLMVSLTKPELRLVIVDMLHQMELENLVLQRQEIKKDFFSGKITIKEFRKEKEIIDMITEELKNK